MNEKTETVLLIVKGKHVPFPLLSQVISSLGGSTHSIDEVEVEHGHQDIKPD